jgi:hypothetical protein
MKKSFTDITAAKIAKAAPGNQRRESFAVAAQNMLEITQIWTDILLSKYTPRMRFSLSMLQMTASLLRDGVAGKIPCFSFGFHPEDEHGEFAKDLIAADIFELPFEPTAIHYKARTDYNDEHPDGYAIFSSLSVEAYLDQMNKSGYPGDPRKELEHFVGRSLGKTLIFFVSGGRSLKQDITVVDGMCMLMTGDNSIGPAKTPGGPRTIAATVPLFEDFFPESMFPTPAARASISVSLSKDTFYALHSTTALLATLLSRDTEIAPCYPPEKLNKARLKRGKPPLETQFLVRMNDEVQLFLDRAQRQRSQDDPGGRSVITHMRRGHIRRWPTTGDDGAATVRLIPIPPCVINPDGGNPIVKDYVVKA